MDSDVKTYSVSEIQDILKSCRESGVTRLQIGTFAAEFSPPEPKTPVAATPTKEDLDAAREFQNQAFLDQEKRIKLEKLSQLRISDPEMFEELQSRGELTDAGEKPDGIES